MLPNRCSCPVCDGCPLLSIIGDLEFSEEAVSISKILQLLTLAVLNLWVETPIRVGGAFHRSRMTLSQGSSKIIGKHRCLHYGS